MKSHLKVLIAALGVASVMPLAHANPSDEYAPVTRVTPHVTTVNSPQQVCHTESAPVVRDHHWYGDDVTYQDVEKCQTVDHYSTQTNGYTVTYLYNGRSYTTEMSYDPGDHVRISVDVQPS
jgi:uncharacterized protein YcfJ